MNALVTLIKISETALIDRVFDYARKMGYAKYTPADEDVWRVSIRGLSTGLIAALKREPAIPELSPDLDFIRDRITAFGVEQARKHRSRGVTLEMLLGLMKYFRQSYQDIVADADLEDLDSRWVHTFIDRYFDRIELGFISEWERATDTLKKHQEKLLLDRNTRLSQANSQLRQEIAERKRAEQQIKKLNVNLERMVEARTLQLQLINEQNNFKVKELLVLNQLGSLNLSKLKLNGLTQIILATLTSNRPLFFDRAMLFLLNGRTQVLQGMLGMMRKNDHGNPAEEPGENVYALLDASTEEANSPLSREIRTCRIELLKGKSCFYRAITENRVVAVKTSPDTDPDLPELFRHLNIGPFAVMPLSGQNGIFGIVIVDNPLSARAISKNDLKFLQLFANHASIAVENLMLYTSLEDANRQLQEAREQLVHGERLATIGEMAASIVHELKGPMVAIGGFARRLARKVPLASIEAEYVSTIIKEEQRLENMLDEVLSFAKKTTLCYERCSITEIVDSSLSILSHVFEKNGVVLLKSFPKKVIMLHADNQQLKQVFINLFQNALEAMRSGGELKVAILSARIGKEKAVAVRVSDSGEGIPVSLQNKIFTPFFTTKTSGTGLGLPISNRIVANHHGKIKVRNNASGGAEFTVLLPHPEKESDSGL